MPLSVSLKTSIITSSLPANRNKLYQGFEQAEVNGFWDDCIKDMKGKMDTFNAVWKELGMPYSEPEGGYFVMVNMGKVKLPNPLHYTSPAGRTTLSWRGL